LALDWDFREGQAFLIEEAAMTVRVYPHVNTTAASNTPANQAEHRQGQHVNTIDQLSSIILLGLAAAGGVAAILLIGLVT